jgi:hypothetical protein
VSERSERGPSDAVDDRIAIVDIILRYAQGLDERNWDMVASCFTADAQATYGDTVLAPGVDNIIGHVRGLENLSASTHLMGGTRIDLHGDEADTFTPAAVFLATGESVRSRGLRYRDHFVRRGDEWRIQVRIHTVHWMYESPALPTGLQPPPVSI